MTAIEKAFLLTSSPSYFRKSELVFWYLDQFTGKGLSINDYEDDETHKLLFIVSQGGEIYERPILKSYYLNSEKDGNINGNNEESKQIKLKEDKVEEGIKTDNKSKFIFCKTTRIINMSTKYRVVISIDTSPSMGVLDLNTGQVIFSKVYNSLERIFYALIEPITLRSSAGNGMQINPEVYISVIAQSTTQSSASVLIQGLLLTPGNISGVLELLKKKLIAIEKSKTFSGNLQNNNMKECDFDNSSDLHNIIQRAWLSLTLLPKDACARIILVTDGASVLKDYSSFDNILMRLNREEISVSIVQLSSFSPHYSLGFVPDSGKYDKQ